MKKRIALLLCILALLAICLVSCKPDDTDEHTHSVLHVEAKAATCTEDGNLEYWYCEDCDLVWSDADQTTVTDLASVKVSATHATLT